MIMDFKTLPWIVQFNIELISWAIWPLLICWAYLVWRDR